MHFISSRLLDKIRTSGDSLESEWILLCDPAWAGGHALKLEIKGERANDNAGKSGLS